MSIAIPLRALLPYALGALEYLLRPLLAPAPITQPVAAPYTPPFAGGQCADLYNVTVRRYYTRTNSGELDNGTLTLTVRGPITGTGFRQIGQNGNGKTYEWFISCQGGANIQQVSTIGDFGGNIIASGRAPIENIVRQDGASSDSCGNVANPNTANPTSSTGLADSGSPNLDNDDVVQAGVPVIAIPSFLSALLAALQAAKSAADALAGVRAIADAIEALADLLNGLKDNADKDKKEKDKNNKEISRHDFGSIRYDGYLRLYPSTNVSDKEATYIDLQLLSIPVWYGKYFGTRSPNFYRFKSLGYISFTSPTFGIIETKEIEFSRMSLNVPANASGFFYHLGLDGAIVGNVSAFYIKAK